MQKKNIQVNFKVDRDLQEALVRLGEWMPSIGKDRSAILRFLVRKEDSLVSGTSYYARTLRRFLFVDKDGTTLAFSREDLHLRSDRVYLPMVIRMKPETAIAIVKGLQRGQDLRQIAQDCWLVNHFAVWAPRDYPQKSPRGLAVDRKGIFAKYGAVEVNGIAGASFLREWIVGIRQHPNIETLPAQPPRDRAGMQISVPVVHLEAEVLVDLQLYSEMRTGKENVNLDYEVVSPEGVPFQARPLSDLAPAWEAGRRERATARVTKGRSSKDPGESKAEESVLATFEEFTKRLRTLSTSSAEDGLPVIDNDRDRRYLRSLKPPKNYLFGKLTWEAPYLGTEVFITWDRPS